MKKPRLWLLLSTLSHPEISYVVPTLAWMARDAGVEFECYLECEREGRLFAETGSTVLGGHHHQQFNYLCAAFDVAVLRLGPTEIFDSSLSVFGVPVIAEAAEPAELYDRLLSEQSVQPPAGIFFGPAQPAQLRDGPARIQPYLFPEILHRRALGASASSIPELCRLARRLGLKQSWAALLSKSELRRARQAPLRPRVVDQVRADDSWSDITLRMARRWRRRSRGVVFGDPPAVLSQLATHCAQDRIAIYAPVTPQAPRATRVSHYVEATSPAARAAGQLACAIGNREITGRQTGDGDIFEWSRLGVSIQIIDPNRPAFPIVARRSHPWQHGPAPGTEEPDDAQLRRWARENKVLTSLVFHSGEVAHNEAMLALVELTAWTGLKLGLGVHADRYETCPQLWELIARARAHGGARGCVEPILHSGGLGVMAECNCPPALLRDNCERALARIRKVAGPDNAPRGYYAFMDSNLDRLDQVRPDLFRAIAAAGLDYVVSSARPGRNRVLWHDRTGRIALNQSPRVVHGASPFVRATTPEDLQTTMGAAGPGWLLATLDAPVISFSPYIWRHGGRFLRLVEEELRGPGRINVTPSTVARYARILLAEGHLPNPT